MSNERKAYEDGFKAGYEKGRADEALERREAIIADYADYNHDHDYSDYGTIHDEWSDWMDGDFTVPNIEPSNWSINSDFISLGDALNTVWENIKDTDQSFTLGISAEDWENLYVVDDPVGNINGVSTFNLLDSDIVAHYNNRTNRYTFWLEGKPEESYDCESIVYERLWDNRTSKEVLDTVKTRIVEANQ